MAAAQRKDCESERMDRAPDAQGVSMSDRMKLLLALAIGAVLAVIIGWMEWI